MSYPASIKQFVTKIDKNASGWYVGPEYFNIPSSSPYQLYLDHVPRSSATTAIGASGAGSWTEIFAGTPLTSQYLVDYAYGKVTFAAADIGTAMQATYYNLGDDIMAEHVNTIQDEIDNIETALAAGVAGGYPNLKARLDASDASGVNGDRIVDNTVRAGALMDDIKGTLWDYEGRPVLTDIYDHRVLSLGAHNAIAISATPGGSSTISTVQDHILMKGSTTITDTNPHGQVLSDIPGNLGVSDINLSGTLTSQNILALDIGASGYIGPTMANGSLASGVVAVGTIAEPFASGNFNIVQAVSYKTGDSSGVTGQFTAGANVITVSNGIIISIV